MRSSSTRRRAARPFLALLAMLVGLSGTTAAECHEGHPIILGWLEWASLEPAHILLKAKLDSGAKTSSLSAIDVEPFERDGAAWVRFTVPISAADGGTDHRQKIAMERALQREALIKRHDAAPALRPVVEIGVCVGGTHFTTPVTLTDRSHFNYPLLLGRSALRDRALIDVAHTYLSAARAESCRAPHTVGVE